MAKQKNINDEVSRCIIQLLLKEPFYAHLLSGIVRTISDDTQTAAVGIKNGKVNLFINENFFLKELTTFSSRVAVVKHETLHLLFKHLFRYDLKKFDMNIFNLAADLVVNQFIGKWNLPKNAITLSVFPDLGLEEDQSVEWYYKKLFALKKEMNQSDSKKNEGKNESEDEESNAENKSSAPLSSEALEKILNEKSHSDHSKWGQANSENQLSAIETDLDRMIVQAKDRTPAKDFGTLPSGIIHLLNAIIEKRNPKINWKRALKIFSSSSRKTKVKYTVKRISKRYGTRPGIKINRYQKMAVAIDTSGSIAMSDYSLFFSEIHAIWREGAEIQVIECDAAVQRVYEYKGKIPEFIQGGGGTSFDPVFEHLKKDRFKKFDGCIYLTDGYANEPKIKPPCKVFWIVTPDGNLGEHLKFGRAVKLEE